MKHLLITCLFACFTFWMSAQDLRSKRGEDFLPEAGEWGIGLDASPFLNYIGNIFNSNNTSPNAAFPNSINTLHAKMYVEDRLAYRARLRIGFSNFTDKENVANVVDPDLTVKDEMKVSSAFLGLGAGLENRRGNTRLQGLYGAEAFLWYSKMSTSYVYGNELSDSNPTNFNVFDPSFDNVKDFKSGSTVGIQLRGFLGAEYFILPKISLGAEYGWGIAFSNIGDGERVEESWNSTDNEVQTLITALAGSSTVSVDTDINNSTAASGVLGDFSLKALFHF